ncbi:MAG: hypothetical protein WBY44_08840 [Bryobacteraceae bacterium]|jgi:hypothetical protein
MIRSSLCAAVLLAGVAAAAPTLTTIQDVLYKADGTRFNGTLSISWSSFQSADDSDIVMQTSTIKVIDGNLRVQLVPSSTAAPAIVYTVTYNSDGRVQFQENWSVPPSATPLRIRDVRVAASGNAGNSSSGNDTTAAISESQVTGLIADLGARPIKGPALAAGRTAIVDASGLIESATGNATDCVHVDGSSGPCGGGTPTFVDGDLPSGIVDGNNATFALAAVPAPATSLSVYRNGVLQKVSADYTAAGNSIQFVAASTPQPGDTLLASYRTADSSGGVTSTFSGYSTTQVLCSGAGATINSATLASLGTCTIPAGLLSQGDRIEIRFDYAHGGAAAGFSIETHWGGTTIVHRDAASTETLIAGRADAGVLASNAQLSSETWGTALAFSANTAVAGDAYSNGLTINFLGLVANSGDSLTLNNFTVVRIP